MITVIYNLCRRYLATQLLRSLKPPVFVNLSQLNYCLKYIFCPAQITVEINFKSK